MASSRERFFKGRVLETLYQDDEDSSDEETRKNYFEDLEKLKKVIKRKALEQPAQDKKTENTDWPVPLPKLKKVYTVAVKPEDLQQTVLSRTQGRDATTSTATSSRYEVSNQQTEDTDSSMKTDGKLSKNKRRKLKKKRRQREKEQDKSQEFTY